MAHFAKLNPSNVVVYVTVVSNDDIQNLPFPESEAVGLEYLNNFFGALEQGYSWRQTSYNGNFRKRYAGIDYTYDPKWDAFIPPKRFDSWVFDEEKLVYVAPIPRPKDGKSYIWDEPTLSWVLVERPA